MMKIKDIFLFFILCTSIAAADELSIHASPTDHCYDESGAQEGWAQKTMHRLGVQSLGQGNTGITFPFLLPELPPEHEVTDVELDIFVEDVSNFFERSSAQAAVYGIRTDKSPAVLSSDTVTAYAEGTLLGDNLFSLSPSLQRGGRRLSLSVAYIKNLYKEGKAGEYVFLTLAPNATMKLENHFAIIASGNHPSTDQQPTLRITTEKIKPFEVSMNPNSKEAQNSSKTPSLILLGVGSFLFMLLKSTEEVD